MEQSEETKYNRDYFTSIKSFYVLKGVISFLSEEQKLDLFKYNKKLQKKLDIDIEVYKEISGRYKIENNGKGMEFILNTDKLIFKGEYEKGRKNGKGIEYYENGNIKFEGEYLNGKRLNGKGYNRIGVNVYEIIDGKGKIREYYDNLKLKFEGEFSNGEIWKGKGKEYNNKGNIK